MTLGSTPVSDTTPMGFSRTLPGIGGSGSEGEYSRILLLSTNQHRKPPNWKIKQGASGKELAEQNSLRSDSQRDLTGRQALKCPQGPVTPELCWDGSAFQEQDLDNTMVSTVLSVHRVSTAKSDSNDSWGCYTGWVSPLDDYWWQHLQTQNT